MEQKKLAVALVACLSLGWAGAATTSGVADAQKEYDEALSLEPNLKNGWWVSLTCAPIMYDQRDVKHRNALDIK